MIHRLTLLLQLSFILKEYSHLPFFYTNKNKVGVIFSLISNEGDVFSQVHYAMAEPCIAAQATCLLLKIVGCNITTPLESPGVMP